MIHKETKGTFYEAPSLSLVSHRIYTALRDAVLPSPMIATINHCMEPFPRDRQRIHCLLFSFCFRVWPLCSACRFLFYDILLWYLWLLRTVVLFYVPWSFWAFTVCVCVILFMRSVNHYLQGIRSLCLFIYLFFITHCIWVIVFVFQGLCSPAPSLDKPTPYSLINLRLTDIDVT